MNISLTPNVLEFKAPLTKPTTEILTITNESSETAAFKVKTTAPKLYCVRPNAGIVEPGQSVEVSIILLGLKEEPTPDFKCNDKFLIVALPSPYDIGETPVAEVWSKLETEFKSQSVSKKIKVRYAVEESRSILEQPATGFSAVPENAGASSQINNRKSVADSADAEKSLSEKLDEVSPEDRSKIDALNEKLDSTAASSPSTSAQVQAKPASNQLTTVILIAIIALIIAWLLL